MSVVVAHKNNVAVHLTQRGGFQYALFSRRTSVFIRSSPDNRMLAHGAAIFGVD
jgi:hypothetical protein